MKFLVYIVICFVCLFVNVDPFVNNSGILLVAIDQLSKPKYDYICEGTHWGFPAFRYCKRNTSATYTTI